MVYYNDFDQGEVWVDKYQAGHPIAMMATAHRIYSARMLDRMAARCAEEYTNQHPPLADWWYPTEQEAETAALDEWLREHDPNEWVQSTTLYRALMDIPEPPPEEDRDDSVPEEGRSLPLDGGLLLREEILAREQLGGPVVRGQDGEDLEQTSENH